MFFIIFSMFIVFSIIMLIGSPKKSFYISFDYSHYTYRELLRRFYIAARGVLF